MRGFANLIAVYMISCKTSKVNLKSIQVFYNPQGGHSVSQITSKQHQWNTEGPRWYASTFIWQEVLYSNFLTASVTIPIYANIPNSIFKSTPIRSLNTSPITLTQPTPRMLADLTTINFIPLYSQNHQPQPTTNHQPLLPDVDVWWGCVRAKLLTVNQCVMMECITTFTTYYFRSFAYPFINIWVGSATTLQHVTSRLLNR